MWLLLWRSASTPAEELLEEAVALFVALLWNFGRGDLHGIVLANLLELVEIILVDEQLEVGLVDDLDLRVLVIPAGGDGLRTGLHRRGSDVDALGKLAERAIDIRQIQRLGARKAVT